MNAGMIAPKIIVVMKTSSSTELFTILIPISSLGLSMVRMRAKATDPLIMPATVTIRSSHQVTFHFL